MVLTFLLTSELMLAYTIARDLSFDAVRQMCSSSKKVQNYDHDSGQDRGTRKSDLCLQGWGIKGLVM